MPHLDIQLLGGFRLTNDGRFLNELNAARQRTLLVYLLLHRNAPQPRHHIAFLFWPDTTEKQALSNLRTLYHRMRQNLPAADLFLQSDEQTIQWLPDAPFNLDVAAFETAVAHAQTITEWQTAVTLYHGLLLPGWYEEWLEPDRKRLQQLFFQANDALLRLLEDQRRYPDAIQTALNLLRHDPLHEATYRRLMRVQALNGEKADALRTYQACASLLESELGVPPDPATRALYGQLLYPGADPEPTPHPASEAAVATLVGRVDEWHQLKRAWQRTTRGRASMVLISGEAGIGKSRLASEFRQWAQRQGIDTAATRAYEAEGELAYDPLLNWLTSPVLQTAWKKLSDGVLTELARLLPDLLVERLDLPAPAPLTQSWQRQRLFAALAEAVLARGRPLLLQIDDLQWCAAETLQWIHFLLRNSPRAPLLIVGTFRTEEVGSEHPLTELQLALRQSRQPKELELEPLSAAETAVLANQLTNDSLDPSDADRLYLETEGNPLFIIEMMHAGLLKSQTLPATIQAIIQSRFVHLTPKAREVMAQMSVIGRAFDYRLMAQTSNLDEDTLVACLDELWRRRIIREHGGMEYDFSHDKIREVAYAELSQARRRLLHRRVAQALVKLHPANIPAYSAQIASHFEMAEMADEAVPYYQRAANAAEQLYAHDEAITYIRRALRLMPLLPDTVSVLAREEIVAQLNETLGDFLHFTAHYDEAQDSYEEAIASVAAMADNVEALQQAIWNSRLHRKAGSTCLSQRQFDAALHQFDLARSALGEEPMAPQNRWWQEWIALQQERKHLFYWLNRWPEIADILAESRPILAKYGTPMQRALFFDAGMFLRRDRFTISEEVLEAMREWFEANLALDDPVRHAAAHFMMGFALLWHGDYREAEMEMDTALEMTTLTGDVNLRARCLTYLTIAARKQGKVEQVLSLATESLAAATDATMPEYVGTARANLAWVAWHEADHRQAEQDARSALALWRTFPRGHASCAFQWTALLPLMAMSMTAGNLDEAVNCAQDLLDLSQQKLPDAITTVLEDAIIAHQQTQTIVTRTLLTKAVTLAQEAGYL